MKIFKLMCLLLPCTALLADIEQVFTNIYSMGSWDESGFSMSGSPIEVSREYVDFLQKFLKEYEIRSVVDVGCGDWAFSRYIDWLGVEYLGIDIVKSVVDRNVQKFGGPSVHFIHANALEMDLPEADLLICKDTLQHLSNRSIFQLISQFHKFKHCLITDAVDPSSYSSHNPDIPNGRFHCVDLLKPPFNVKGYKALVFEGFWPKQTVHIEP